MAVMIQSWWSGTCTYCGSDILAVGRNWGRDFYHVTPDGDPAGADHEPVPRGTPTRLKEGVRFATNRLGEFDVKVITMADCTAGQLIITHDGGPVQQVVEAMADNEHGWLFVRDVDLIGQACTRCADWADRSTCMECGGLGELGHGFYTPDQRDIFLLDPQPDLAAVTR